MMKSIVKFIIAIPFLIFFFLLFVFNVSGPPAGYTGSPGDANNCTACHRSANSYNTTVSLSHNIPASGYVPGTTYQLTLTATSNSNKLGFQMTAESNNNQRQGSFSSSDSYTQTIGNNQYIEHTSQGTTQSSWNFNWTAPSQNVGTITFYVAVNATNGNGQLTGDTPVMASFSVSANTAIGTSVIPGIKLYPNPVENLLFIDYISGRSLDMIRIFDITGKMIYRIENPARRIDFSGLDAGKYIIEIKADSKEGTYLIEKIK